MLASLLLTSAVDQCPPGTEPASGTGLLGALVALAIGIACAVICFRWAARSESARTGKLLLGVAALIAGAFAALWWYVSHILTCQRV